MRLLSLDVCIEKSTIQMLTQIIVSYMPQSCGTANANLDKSCNAADDMDEMVSAVRHALQQCCIQVRIPVAPDPSSLLKVPKQMIFTR